MLETDNLSDEIRGQVYFNKGILAEDRGEYKNALSHFLEAEKCIKITSAHNSETPAPSRSLFAYNIIASRMRILNNLGRTYLKAFKYELARGYFEGALREPGPEIERAAVLNNYGLLECEQGHYEQAYEYIKQAVQLAENDAWSSEFKHNLDIVLKHLIHAGANPERKIN